MCSEFGMLITDVERERVKGGGGQEALCKIAAKQYLCQLMMLDFGA